MSELCGKDIFRNQNKSFGFISLFENFGNIVKQNRLTDQARECVELARSCLFELDEEMKLQQELATLKNKKELSSKVQEDLEERKEILKEIFNSGTVTDHDGESVRSNEFTKLTKNPASSEIISLIDDVITEGKKWVGKKGREFLTPKQQNPKNISTKTKTISRVRTTIPYAFESYLTNEEETIPLLKSLKEEKEEIVENVRRLKFDIATINNSKDLNQLSKTDLLKRIKEMEKILLGQKTI